MNKPESGFYFHYKHDEKVGWNDHAYYVYGVTWHTEENNNCVLYRPLYKERDFMGEADYCIRPLDMFIDKNVEWEGRVYEERFRKIKDPALIKKLEEEKEKLYPSQSSSSRAG